jgi:hypothetical protein
MVPETVSQGHGRNSDRAARRSTSACGVGPAATRREGLGRCCRPCPRTGPASIATRVYLQRVYLRVEVVGSIASCRWSWRRTQRCIGNGGLRVRGGCLFDRGCCAVVSRMRRSVPALAAACVWTQGRLTIDLCDRLDLGRLYNRRH